MRYLKKFNEDLFFGFQVDKVLEEWGVPSEYFEDIFVEFYDTGTRKDVSVFKSTNNIWIRPIESGSRRKLCSILYANNRFKMDKRYVDLMVGSLIKRLNIYNIEVIYDPDYDHERTIPTENIWFVSLRLINKDDYKMAKDQDLL